MPPSDDWPWDRYRAVLLIEARKLKYRLNPHLKSRCDSSVLVQETLLRADNKLFGYRGGPTDGERLAWMRKILHRYLIDWVRKEAKIPEQDVADGWSKLKDDVSSPSHRVEGNEEIARLHAALLLLPENWRAVITVHTLEGKTIKETAERLGLETPKVAAGLYARGLERLRELLDNDT